MMPEGYSTASTRFSLRANRWWRCSRGNAFVTEREGQAFSPWIAYDRARRLMPHRTPCMKSADDRARRFETHHTPCTWRAHDHAHIILPHRTPCIWSADDRARRLLPHLLIHCQQRRLFAICLLRCAKHCCGAVILEGVAERVAIFYARVRQEDAALYVQGVWWGINLRARSSTLYVQGVRWGINLRARSPRRPRRQRKGQKDERTDIDKNHPILPSGEQG